MTNKYEEAFCRILRGNPNAELSMSDIHKDIALVYELIIKEKGVKPIITEEIAMCRCGKGLEYEMKNDKVQFKRNKYCPHCGRRMIWDE